MPVDFSSRNFFTDMIRYYMSKGVSYSLAYDAACHNFDEWYHGEKPYRYTNNLIH